MLLSFAVLNHYMQHLYHNFNKRELVLLEEAKNEKFNHKGQGGFHKGHKGQLTSPARH
jgi:hypothetical protein